MLLGYATPEATERYAARFGHWKQRGFYRRAQGLHVSGIGLGTYLGALDDTTTHAYSAAIEHAVMRGINFIDTSLNYRHQRSERAIGAAIMRLKETGRIDRDEFVVCSKAGFLVPEAVPADQLRPGDIVDGMHSMAPAFLVDQLERSRMNLNLETIDVFYLHNPETQLGAVQRDVFEQRLRDAFLTLEKAVADGRIRWYGAATWEGLRKPGQLSLPRLAQLARETAGDNHHFRFIQLPYNLAMTEAFTTGILETAQSLGITAVASASLLQTRLLRGMPDAIVERLPGLTTNAQRALQFARSTPGLTTALVGMSQTAHVDENLGVAAVAPLEAEAYRAFFQPAA